MKVKQKKLNSNFFDFPIAHRGLHFENIAENSINAFDLAIKNNCAIELDVHRLTDGEFAVFHDRNLKRMTGNDINIATLSSKELEKFNLFDGQKIPLLDEVLKLIDAKVPLLVELKPEDAFKNNDIEPLLQKFENYKKDMVAFQCFNPLTVRKMKKSTNNYSVGLLSTFKYEKMGIVKRYLLKTYALFKFSHADFVSFDVNFLPNKYISKLKKKKIPVFAWVTNNDKKYNIAKNFADNIIFEKMEVLKEYEKDRKS